MSTENNTTHNEASNELKFEMPATQNEVKPESKSIVESTDQESESWKLAQRKANALSKSDLLPQQYRNNVANCLVAMELANRTGMNELMVMQNLHIIQGKPSWSSTFAIAVINSSKRFRTMLNFKVDGTGDDLTCTAWAVGHDDEIYESPKVSMSIAKNEGWLNKSGSKWKTMPELMIRYRAAAFFGRLFCPELLLGMQTDDEVIDVSHVEIKSDELDVEFLRQQFNAVSEFIPEQMQIDIERILKNEETASYKKVASVLAQYKIAE